MNQSRMRNRVVVWFQVARFINIKPKACFLSFIVCELRGFALLQEGISTTVLITLAIISDFAFDWWLHFLVFVALLARFIVHKGHKVNPVFRPPQSIP